MEGGVPATGSDGGVCVLRRHHARTIVVNKDATTYAKFAADATPGAVRARVLLVRRARLTVRVRGWVQGQGQVQG